MTLKRNSPFAKRIRALALARGQTQEQIAHDIGVTHNTLIRWINGHSAPVSRPTLAVIERMEDEAEAGKDGGGHERLDASAV